MFLFKAWRFLTGFGTNLGLCGAGSYMMFFAPREGTAPLDYTFNSRWIGALMVLAWFCQTAGAWLKRYHLQERLDAIYVAPPPRPPDESGEDAPSAEPGGSHPFLGRVEGQIVFFMIMHPFIAGILLGMGLKNLFPGLPSKGPWVAFEAIFIVTGAILCTVLTARAFFRFKTPVPRGSWWTSRLTGFLADAMLIFSFLVLFTTIFGMPQMMQGIRPIHPQSVAGWLASIFLFVPLLWLGLMLFFIPFRILLMAEELGTWRSRLSSLIAVSPIILKYIIG